MSPRAIISLSSIPPRFDALGPTLLSLVNQKGTGFEVELWIPYAYRRFPDWDGRLPDVPHGVTVLRCQEDLGPATKILPSIMLHRGQNLNIVFCDDDRLYHPNWLSSLLAVAETRPNACIATYGRDIPSYLGIPEHSADRRPRFRRFRPESQNLPGSDGLSTARTDISGFADLVYGYCGASVKPAFFSEAALRLPPVLWAVDDVWLSGHLEVQGIPIWVDASIPFPEARPGVMETEALEFSKIEGHGRWQADRKCVEYFRKNYGIWKPSLREAALGKLRFAGFLGNRARRASVRRLKAMPAKFARWTESRCEN